MRLFLLLSVFAVATVSSDIARVYVPGTEPAKGNSNLAVVWPNGKELATNANAGLAITEVSGKEKSKLASPGRNLSSCGSA